MTFMEFVMCAGIISLGVFLGGLMLIILCWIAGKISSRRNTKMETIKTLLNDANISKDLKKDIIEYVM